MRCLISVLACLVLVGCAFAEIGAFGLDVESMTVLMPLGVPLLVLWLSVLVSALSNQDRRGWHDMAARTMLVRVPVPGDSASSQRGS